MYARCPHCETIFAIAAAHLRAAHGEVKCGRCQRVFDAIPHLTDGIEDAARTPPAGQGAGGEAGLLEPGEALAGLPPREVPREAIVSDARPEEVAPLSGPSSTGEAALETTAENAAKNATTADSIPAVLRDGLVPSSLAPRRGRRLAWRLAALALLATLAAQYAWFEPRELLASYPRARAQIASWCAWTGCDLGEGRDTASLRVVTRDVRVHPRFEGALQVNAVLVNTASFAQRYPRVRFSLFNVNGDTVGARTFEPAEYLGAPPAPGAMLAPHVPVQIALDLLAPEDISVSFEFRFL